MTFNSTVVFISVLATLLPLTYSVSALKFTDCTSGSTPDAKLQKVTVSNCDPDKDSRCILTRGTNATIDVDFETITSFDSAKLVVNGKISFVVVPFPMHPDQACGNYGFDCPVKINDNKRLHIAMPILKSYPKIDLAVQIKLLDEKENPIICIEFPASIKDPKKL